MISLLKDIFENQGTLSQISGNTPILLTGKDQVWCVISGSVEVFVIQVKDGRLSGSKEYFFSAGEGHLLFGMDLEDYGMGQGFQAVGYPGTQVARLSLERLKELGSDPIYEAEIGTAADTWAAGLTRGLTKDILPRPRPEVLLDSGCKTLVDKDEIAYPRNQPLWIRYKDQSGLFISTEQVFAGDTLLPLCEGSWILMLKGSAIETLSTRDALSQGLVWQSLEYFYSLIFQIAFLNTSLKTVDVYNLLSESAEQNNRAKQGGLIRLASVLDKKNAHGSHDQKFNNPLLTACACVGESLGILVKEPALSAKDTKSPLAIDDIARASHCNIRRVKLQGKWWQKENGPLVGFMAEDNRPIAILPLSPLLSPGNEMRDPVTGKQEKITAKTAKGFATHAYTFYRFLPDRAVTGWDLVKFGLKGCGKELKSILVIACIIGMLSLITPLATGLVFSEIIPSSELNRIWGIVVILAGFGLTTALFEITRNIGILRVESKLHYCLESAIIDRILRLPIPFFKKYEAGDLASRAMGINMVRQIVSGPLITSIVGSFFSLFNFILLFYYHRNLALVATGLLVLAGLIIASLSIFQLRYLRQQTKIEGKISGRVLQFLNAITKLRVAGSEDRAFAIWAKDFSQQKKMSFKGGVIGTLLMTFNSVFLVFSLMALFSWLIFQEKGSGLGTGDFLAFNAAFASLQASVFQIILSVNMFIMAIPYLERMRPILEHRPETDIVKTDPGLLVGKIEICHLAFRYTKDGPPVLKDISMNIETGSFVAIVGPSGSGKSTLIRMMLGFEKPESGTIYYDDQDLAELDVTRVRQNMGVVIQGGNVMAGDIFNNIIGNHPLTLDDAWEAASMAGLDEDIRQMPMGMNTMVMEGGSTLSGGQRQRLMIARAIVNRPGILIFDEATSALDNRTQSIVSESLKKLKATRIVVAHRLSTIKEADCIHVMDKGSIKESGTYAQLMEKDGLFRRIAQRQIA